MKDRGTRVLERKRRRQWMTLASLLVVGLVIALVQWTPSMPMRAAGSPAGNEGAATLRVDELAIDQAMSRRLQPAVEVNWPTQLRRDLFAWESVFEGAQDEEPQETEPADDTPRVDPAEVRRDAQRRLQLQVIIHGLEPMAMINGEVRRRGDQIEGFELVRLEHGRIVVARDGVEVIIEID